MHINEARELQAAINKAAMELNALMSRAADNKMHCTVETSSLVEIGGLHWNAVTVRCEISPIDLEV